MSRRRQQIIESTAQMKALASPMRQEIVDTVNALTVCSIRQIAAALGCPSDGLYYHIRALMKVGLLVQAGVQKSGRRDEMLLSTPTRGIMRLRYDPEKRANVAAVTRIVGSMIRVAERDFKAGFRPGMARCGGRERNLNASRQKAWLTRENRIEVNTLLARLQEIFSQSQPAEGSELHSLTFVLAPIEPAETEPGTSRRKARE